MIQTYKTWRRAFSMHLSKSLWSCWNVYGQKLNTNCTLSVPQKTTNQHVMSEETKLLRIIFSHVEYRLLLSRAVSKLLTSKFAKVLYGLIILPSTIRYRKDNIIVWRLLKFVIFINENKNGKKENLFIFHTHGAVWATFLRVT